jgi:hypothetical protein
LYWLNCVSQAVTESIYFFLCSSIALACTQTHSILLIRIENALLPWYKVISILAAVLHLHKICIWDYNFCSRATFWNSEHVARRLHAGRQHISCDQFRQFSWRLKFISIFLFVYLLFCFTHYLNFLHPIVHNVIKVLVTIQLAIKPTLKRVNTCYVEYIYSIKQV